MSRVQKRAEWMRRRRLEFLLALVVLMALLLGLRAADLQLFHRGSLLQKAVAQREDVLKIPAPRGDILDAQGRVLAASVRVPSIACFAEEVPKEAVGRLARALELEPKRLARRLSAREGFVWLRRQVPPEMARRVQALDVPGVQVIHEWRRYYPLGAAMGPVLGFVDIDGKGIEGIEFVRDRWLAGHPGRKVVVRDAKGRTLQARWLDEPRPGRPLRLTLDATMQQLAFAALSRAVEREQAKAGAIVVLRVSDRAILAMASVPSFNPNVAWRYPPQARRNRAVVDVFEPGSALKPVTYAAAIEALGLDLDTPLDCGAGSWPVADRVIHDPHPIGKVTAVEALARSSNICAAQLALRLGPVRLFRMLRAFGFGARTQAGLPGESKGIVRPPEAWGPVETATIAFGQGISVTLLQLANAFATIADGGVWRAPFWDQDRKPSLARRVIRAETAERLVRMLEASVSDRGTGALARVAGWRVAGKTGTPQRVAPGGGYAENRFDGVFVGFAPVDDPEIVVAVRVEDPQQHKAGGTAAAPVFAEVVQASLPYLGRPPEETGIALAAFPGQSARNWPGPGWSLRAARRMARKAGATLLAHGHGWAVRARPLSPQRGKRWEVWFAEAAW